MCLLDKAVIIITSKDLAVKSTDLVLLNYLYISRFLFSVEQMHAHRRAFWLCRKLPGRSLTLMLMRLSGLFQKS